VQPPVGIEHVRQAQQIPLVSSTAVMQDQQARGIAGRWAFAVEQAHRAASR
jgi:hypothetical protein